MEMRLIVIICSAVVAGCSSAPVVVSQQLPELDPVDKTCFDRPSRKPSAGTRQAIADAIRKLISDKREMADCGRRLIDIIESTRYAE